VAIGAALLGLVSWPNLWVYFVAEFAAAAVAAFILKFANPGDN